MRPVHSLFSIAGLAATTGLLAVAAAPAQPVEGGPDPSTPYGQSVLQNQQYQQQEQQNEQFQQQLQQEQQQRNQQFQQEQRQYYGSQGGGEGAEMSSSGPFAAMYFDPRTFKSMGSWNFSSPVSARAAAIGGCYKANGVTCKKALEFNNACGAFAYSKASGVWAARSANSQQAANALAIAACRAAGGKDCAVHLAYCSPNDN